MGRSAGGDPAPGPEVLLRRQQLPAEDFHRAATWHGGALRTAQLPIERSSPLADAYLGWPCWSATGTPARTSGVQIDSSALAAAPDAADRRYSSARAIWKQARSSTYYLIGRQQPWPHGCKITPEQRSSAVTGPVLMPRPHAEPLRKPSRSPIVGTLCAT
jgi:hypothetical protein